jgi:probable HAF family extracellular repeat protein
MDPTASSPPSTAAVVSASPDQSTSTPSTTTSSASSPSSGSSSSAAPTSSAPSPATASLPIYKIIEIPRLAATGSVTVTGVNGQGVAVGQLETTTAPRAWIYQQTSGALNELTLDPANGITNGGVIAGAEVPNGPPVPGFWTVTGGAMLLSGTYQSSAQAIAANDNGTIVGNYGQSGSVSSLPLVWTAPGYAETTLPGLQCDQCTRTDVVASAINASGLIAGSSNYSIYNNGAYVSSGMHATEWQDGTITDLGGLQGADYSAAYAVNSSGDVVGGSRTDPSSGAPTHAFLYQQGAMTDLGTLAGDSTSSADSINDSGQMVGVSQSDTASRAFLYENGQMYDLNSLIDPASPLVGLVTLDEAVSVSSNGWIAVNGTDSRDPGWERAFLLIPSS